MERCTQEKESAIWRAGAFARGQNLECGHMLERQYLENNTSTWALEASRLREAKGRLVLSTRLLLSTLMSLHNIKYNWQVARKFQYKDQQETKYLQVFREKHYCKKHQIQQQQKKNERLRKYS